MTEQSGTPKRTKVLVVDDELGNVELLRRSLRRHYEVFTAGSGEEGLELLRAQPDMGLVLTDQRMPGMSGVDLLQHARQVAPEAVRIIFTGYTDFQDVLDAINLGQVNRLILKPIEPEKLLEIIGDALAVYHLAQERKFLLSELEVRNRRLEAHEQELKGLVAERTAELEMRNVELQRANERLSEANAMLAELALRDGLTGLYNHRYFHERLAAEIARSRRHDRSVSLLFIDIDHFKHLNDRFGHQAGDAVLRELAGLLVSGSRLGDVVARLRASDVVARYGGEEFAVILPETAMEGAATKAENVRGAIEHYPFQFNDTVLGQVTVSIGVASLHADIDSASALIREADKALYRAKDAGRNRIECAEPRGARAGAEPPHRAN